jgi:hypothetical protein
MADSFFFISISRLSRNRECSWFILRFYVADSNFLAIEMLCVIGRYMIENRALVYIGDFGRLSGTGRALKGVLNAASTPFPGGGKHHSFL